MRWFRKEEGAIDGLPLSRRLAFVADVISHSGGYFLRLVDRCSTWYFAGEEREREMLRGRVVGDNGEFSDLRLIRETLDADDRLPYTGVGTVRWEVFCITGDRAKLEPIDTVLVSFRVLFQEGSCVLEDASAGVLGGVSKGGASNKNQIVNFGHDHDTAY